MTLSDIKDITYFIADGISNPAFIHLRNTYNRIIKRDNVILISINNKTDINDKSFLDSSGISEPLKNISEIDLNISENSFIFPNASSLPTGNNDFIKSKTGCFIGGINSKDTIQKQIISATSLNIDFLFSDLLPTEVSNFINSEELTFFCKRINFIQPYFLLILLKRNRMRTIGLRIRECHGVNQNQTTNHEPHRTIHQPNRTGYSCAGAQWRACVLR